MRAVARLLPAGLLAEPAMIALLVLLAGIAGIGGLALHALGRPADHVCTIVLPHRSSAIGAFVELQERVSGTDCRRGDVLAISGDVHLEALARFCDFARGVTLQHPSAETGRPAGALCTYAGEPRSQRGG
jgi:hypothetical protein